MIDWLAGSPTGASAWLRADDHLGCAPAAGLSDVVADRVLDVRAALRGELVKGGLETARGFHQSRIIPDFRVRQFLSDRLLPPLAAGLVFQLGNSFGSIAVQTELLHDQVLQSRV